MPDNVVLPSLSDTEIQEGEIVSSAPSSSAVDQTLDLTGLINNHINQVDHLKVELAQLKEMLDSIFANDSVYQQHDSAVKEAVKVRGQTKKQIQKLPQTADLLAKIQDMKTTLKELQSHLSDYLQDYAKSTGSTSFETDDGQVRQIVYTAKLISKSKYNP